MAIKEGSRVMLKRGGFWHLGYVSYAPTITIKDTSSLYDVEYSVNGLRLIAMVTKEQMFEIPPPSKREEREPCPMCGSTKLHLTTNCCEKLEA